jgi:hypothetical protein
LDLDVSIVTKSVVNRQLQGFNQKISNLAVAIREQYLFNSTNLQLVCK